MERLHSAGQRRFVPRLQLPGKVRNAVGIGGHASASQGGNAAAWKQLRVAAPCDGDGVANGALDAGSRGEGGLRHTRVYLFQPSARQIACRKQSRLAQIPTALESVWNAEFAQHTVYQSLRIRGQMRHFLHRGKHLAHAGGDRLQFTGLSDHIAHAKRLQLLRVLLRQRAGERQGHRRPGQRVCRRQDRYAVALRQQKTQNQDIRLLQHLKEVEEPFEKTQIGSSAMAYKRNPMRSERIASLSRYVMVDALNPAITSATQWFERTLDDSANKRLSVPEGFLAIDGILDLCLNVVDGLVVYPKVIEKHMMAELPFMATENIMMDAVKAGGDRQELHERIRVLSMEAGKHVKEEGKENNLLELIAADPAFNMTLEELQKSMEPSRYVGRAPRQVDNFLKNVVNPILEENKELLGVKAEILV